MRQRSRFFVANIVLGIIFAIFFFISLTVTIVINETLGDVEGIYGDLSEEYLYDDYSYENDVYSLLSIENADAQLIGEEYLGETAYEGYQYYRVEYQIHNAGTIYETLGYLDLDCQGEEDEDAYQEYYFDDSDSMISYCNNEIIPPCQTANGEMIMQVEKGVTDVTLVLCIDYDTEEYQYYPLHLGE